MGGRAEWFLEGRILIHEPDHFARWTIPVLFLLARGGADAVHVHAPSGEAKFWLEPKIELAQNHGLSIRQVNAALRVLLEHENEIRKAWKTHFSG